MKGNQCVVSSVNHYIIIVVNSVNYITIVVDIYIYIYIYISLWLSIVVSSVISNIITACRREAKPSFPLPLTGTYRLEGATFANRLAISRNYQHSWVALVSTSLNPSK